MATTDSSAGAHPSPEENRLAKLEERFRHEILDVEERCKLRDRILCLCRKLAATR
jgi:hypothetical protein